MSLLGERMKEWVSERRRTEFVADAPVTIRRLESADWSALRAIRLEALTDAPEAFGSTLQGALRLSARQWRHKVSTSLYFVAERGGVVVGMVSGGYNDNQPGTHWLYGMYVTPAARGGEAAQLLVGSVVEWARAEGAHEIYLHVASGVPRARAFYLKNGFTFTGEPFTMERDPSVTMYTMTKSTEPDFRVAPVDPSALHELRRRVLRQNDLTISVAEPRDAEPTSVHFAGLLDGRVVVSASFYPTPAPVRADLPSYQLRYMAVDFDVQGQGYGAEVLAVAESALRDAGAQQLWANARDTALGFYLKTGWELIPDSGHVSAETQLPHHRIAKLLHNQTNAAES
jgi:GNAT superfamily N-acetyltransferase